jgi:hypothetical protein
MRLILISTPMLSPVPTRTRPRPRPSLARVAWLDRQLNGFWEGDESFTAALAEAVVRPAEPSAASWRRRRTVDNWDRRDIACVAEGLLHKQ